MATLISSTVWMQTFYNEKGKGKWWGNRWGTQRVKNKKTYNTGDSLVVTDPTTGPAVTGLSMGERTGSRVFQYLWSYVQCLPRRLPQETSLPGWFRYPLSPPPPLILSPPGLRSRSRSHQPTVVRFDTGARWRMIVRICLPRQIRYIALP